VAYSDLVALVRHIDTFAKDAYDPDVLHPKKKKSTWKMIGEDLGISFAQSNPRKLIKKAKKPIGHLPLEILSHLAAYIEGCVANNTLSSPAHQTQLGKGGLMKSDLTC
jgi:ion channel-forming bestrophin family protein